MWGKYRVGGDVWLGSSAVILDGVTVGNNSIIGNYSECTVKSYYYW